MHISMKMTFEEFTDTVKNNIQDYLPEKYQDAHISTQDFHKLNSSYLSMQVRLDDNPVVPNINLEKFYEEFIAQGGTLRDLDSILNTMAQQIQNEPTLETAWLMDYSNVKDKLFIRVSDAKENAAMLAKAPHQEFDGLAVTYHIAFEGEHGIQASTPVTNSMLEMYGINEQQLRTDAMESVQNAYPSQFISLGAMMSRMMGVDEEMMPPMDVPQLMVLTNDQALYGAGALFYPGQLDTIASQIGSDYFVIPSSIHEVLILPDDGTIDRHAIESMIQEVNMTAVAPEERLSDHAYHYDAKDHILEKADTYASRMEEKELQAENPVRGSAEERSAETSPKEEISQSVDLREDPADRAAESTKETVSEKDNGRGPDQKTSRESHEKAGHDRGGREEKHGRERKSILSRLNEKKQQVMSQPQRNVPARTKNAEL